MLDRPDASACQHLSTDRQLGAVCARAGYGPQPAMEEIRVLEPDGQRLGIRARRRRPGLDRGVLLRALASIEHAVVADDAHDSMTDAGMDWRAEFLRRGPVMPRRPKRRLPHVVDTGKNVVMDQVRLISIEQQPLRKCCGGYA